MVWYYKSNRKAFFLIYCTKQKEYLKGTYIMQEIFKPEGYNLDRSENRDCFKSVASLEAAFAQGKTVEGTVIKCDTEKNLTVRLGDFTGIIPKCEAVLTPDGEQVRDIAVITRVGKSVCAKITDIEKNADGTVTVMLSRRLAQEECRDMYVKNLVPGEIIDARITHIDPFGAFCDIGCGIISLLSVDCISVSRITGPKDRFRVGQYIKAIVKTPMDELGRITLSHKELLGTWQENAERFAVGETCAGIVRSIESYGIFVELAPNLAGLAESREGVRVGQTAAVYIKSIIPEKMKIKLAIVDTQDEASSPKSPEYFIDEGRITYWQYSPEEAVKLIATDFTEYIPE